MAVLAYELSQIIVSEACFGQGDLAGPLSYPLEDETESCGTVYEIECGHPVQCSEDENKCNSNL